MKDKRQRTKNEGQKTKDKRPRTKDERPRTKKSAAASLQLMPYPNASKHRNPNPNGVI
jgi:hypothetical protein